MILTCPSCATRYFADDAALGPHGRTVRCAACSHSWFAEAQLVLDQAAPDDLLPAATATAPLTREQVERMRQGLNAPAAAASIRAKQAERRRQERVRAAAAAWGGAGVVLALTTTGAIAFREDVAEAWPKTASAYAAMGLHVNIWGLEFADLDIERGYEGPTPVLAVSGAIRNIGGQGKQAPVLRFSLRDENATEIYAWTMSLDGQDIPAGAAIPFRTVIDNPPGHAVDLEATFATAKEAEALATSRPSAPSGAPHAAPLHLGPALEVDPGAAPAALDPADHGAADVPLAVSADHTAQIDSVSALEPLRARPLQDLAPRMSADEVVGAIQG